MKPVPSLATNWSISENGKIYTFKLREGVRFHDGTPFTSDDAKISLETVSKHNPRSVGTFRELVSVSAPDSHTLKLTFKSPAPYIFAGLTSVDAPMMPKHALEGTSPEKSKLANHPIGTGPFKFIEWRRGEFVRLDKNEKYWRENLPYLDRVVARFVPDSSTRASLLEKESVHFAGLGSIPFNMVNRLEKNSNLAVTTQGNELISQVSELIFNTQRPPFDNKKVRQAINYAVDRDFLIKNVFFGYAKPAKGPISSNYSVTGLFNAGVKNYGVENRIELANNLLDEAGFLRKKDGIRFKIVHDILPYGEEWRRAGEAVQQQLSAVGINVVLRNEDVPSWIRRVYTNYDFEMTSSYLFNLADPVIGMHRGLHSYFIQKGTPFVNGARWKSDRADQLMNQATVETNHDARAKAYQDLSSIVAEESPIVYTMEITFPTIYNKKLHGAITPQGVYSSFAEAWLEK
jgi:peptide/nickel transport system substrate-binding protein